MLGSNPTFKVRRDASSVNYYARSVLKITKPLIWAVTVEERRDQSEGQSSKKIKKIFRMSMGVSADLEVGRDRYSVQC